MSSREERKLPPKDGIVIAAGLTRFYGTGGNQVAGVRGIDLTIRAGELVVLKGMSGSGKSTLLSLLAGLDRPSEGRLTVDGHDLNAISGHRLTEFRRRAIGMVFQSFNLLPTLTVEENVHLPALLAGKPWKYARQAAEILLEWLGLAARATHFPSELSGGEMQRTAIARALINRPALILADEPTGNLDSANGGKVIELLAGLNKASGRTVIIATHSDLADLLADRVLYLKDGSLAA